MRLTAGPLMYVERLEAMLHEFSALTLDGGQWLDSLSSPNSFRVIKNLPVPDIIQEPSYLCRYSAGLRAGRSRF
jgi:hypothetical protein